MAGEWPTVRLEEVALVTDYVANGSFALLKENVTYRSKPAYAILVRTVDFNNAWNGHYVWVDDHAYNFLSKSRLEPGDLVLSNVGSVGLVFRVPNLGKPMTLGPNAVMCRTRDRGRLDQGFLYYFFLSEKGQEAIRSITSGSVQPKFNKTDLRVLRVPLPPISEQRAIAHILGTLDDKIELNRRMNETLEAMARALFKSWFVDFEPVRAKMEGRWHPGESLPGLPAHLYDLFPNSLVDSELGEIPEGWEVKSLGDLADLIKGVSYSSAELQPSRTALVTLKSFNRGGGYRSDGLKPFIGDYKDEQVIRPGEVVISFTDVTQAAEVIGRSALVRSSPDFDILVASLDVGIIRQRNAFLKAPFFYCLLSSEDFVDYILGYVNGTTVLHLDKAGVPLYRFACPPVLIAEAWANLCVRIYEQIDQNEHESRTLAALRDALLPKLISGEIRVKNAEKIVETDV